MPNLVKIAPAVGGLALLIIIAFAVWQMWFKKEKYSRYGTWSKKKCPSDFPVPGRGSYNMGKCCKGAYSRICEGDSSDSRYGTWSRKCPSDFPVRGKGPDNMGKCCKGAYSRRCSQ
jgi:hypothetical protein